jgi:hypothetical protein
VNILVANEPRSYRQTFVEALRALRPGVAVVEGQPEDLDKQIGGLAPDLVICSQLTLAVEKAPAWVLMYPAGDPVTMVCTAGKLSSFVDIDLDKLLSIVDRAADLANSEPSPR